MQTKRVLSLFSGCGGMDIGLEGGFTCLKSSVKPDCIAEDYGRQVKVHETGFKTVFANDIRKEAKACWVSYFGKDVYHVESIVDLVKKARNSDKVFPDGFPSPEMYPFPDNIDVVTGGFPCQDFSLAGKRQGFNSSKSHTGCALNADALNSNEENRGQLYLWMKEVIQIVQPKIFIAENVKSLISLENAKEIIEKDFTDAGYLVLSKVLQAADYGVPQSRERVFFIGFKKSSLTPEALLKLSDVELYPDFDPFPRPHRPLNRVSCGEALEDLLEPEATTDPSQQKYSKCKLNRGQGNKEINLSGCSPTIRSEHHGNIEFRRLALENGGKNIEEINSGLKQRRLTVRECARLQTFPDDYHFIPTVSASVAYKLIGNAVPCVLAYSIGKTLSDN